MRFARRVRSFRCKFSGIWVPWVLWSWFCLGKNQPVLRQTKTPLAVGQNPTTTDVQHFEGGNALEVDSFAENCDTCKGKRRCTERDRKG